MLFSCIILKVIYTYVQGSDLILLAGENVVTLPPKLTHIQQLNHWFNSALTQIYTPVSSLVRVSTARQAEDEPAPLDKRPRVIITCTIMRRPSVVKPSVIGWKV